MTQGCCSVRISESARRRLGLFLTATNALLSVGALSLLVIGIYMNFGLETRIQFAENYELQRLHALLVTCGIFMLLVHTSAIKISYDCAYYKTRERSKKLLLLYQLIIFILSVIVSITLIYSLIQNKRLYKALDRGLTTALKLYKKNATIKVEIDKLQEAYECCGHHHFKDWFKISWVNTKQLNKKYSSLKDRDMSEAELLVDAVPFSCCDPSAPLPCRHHQLDEAQAHVHYTPGQDRSLYEIGCVQSVERSLTRFVFAPLMRIVGLLILLQLITLVLTRYLQTSIDGCVHRRQIAIGYLFRCRLFTFTAELTHEDQMSISTTEEEELLSEQESTFNSGSETSQTDEDNSPCTYSQQASIDTNTDTDSLASESAPLLRDTYSPPPPAVHSLHNRVGYTPQNYAQNKQEAYQNAFIEEQPVFPTSRRSSWVEKAYFERPSARKHRRRSYVDTDVLPCSSTSSVTEPRQNQPNAEVTPMSYLDRFAEIAQIGRLNESTAMNNGSDEDGGGGEGGSNGGEGGGAENGGGADRGQKGQNKTTNKDRPTKNKQKTDSKGKHKKGEDKKKASDKNAKAKSKNKSENRKRENVKKTQDVKGGNKGNDKKGGEKAASKPTTPVKQPDRSKPSTSKKVSPARKTTPAKRTAPKKGKPMKSKKMGGLKKKPAFGGARRFGGGGRKFGGGKKKFGGGGFRRKRK